MDTCAFRKQYIKLASVQQREFGFPLAKKFDFIISRSLDGMRTKSEIDCFSKVCVSFLSYLTFCALQPHKTAT